MTTKEQYKDALEYMEGKHYNPVDFSTAFYDTIHTALLAQIEAQETVKFPQSVDEALLMALLSIKYLEENAPEYLKKLGEAPVNDEDVRLTNPEVVTVAEAKERFDDMGWNDIAVRCPNGVKIVEGV